MSKTKIVSLLDDYGDGIHGTPVYSDTGEYYFINGNNLNDGRIQITNDTLKIDVSEYLRIKRPLNENTLLMSINGTLGKIALYRGEKIALGKSACFLNATSTINRDFIRWVLSTTAFRQYMMQVAHGSTIKNLAPSQIAEYEFQDVQDKELVVQLLNSLDNKIDLNNRICAELEAMAKTLYDYWFVQFDFPDENGKPYRTSGGAMEWCQELGREVPKGWKVKQLNEILILLKDGTHNPPKRIKSGIPLLTGTMFGNLFLDYSQATYISSEDYRTIHSQYAPQANDIVLTKIGTLGNVNYLRNIDLPIAIHCNSALLRFPEYMSGMFSVMYCKSDEFFKRLKAAKGQSVQEFCSLERIGSLKILVPHLETIITYNSKTKAILTELERISLENNELIRIRDWLLPMLMNGQAQVEK